MNLGVVAEAFFDGTKPDLLVSGPNVGQNTGIAVLGAGTMFVSSDHLIRLHIHL